MRPELVAQVRFTEWTADSKLRHPVYLGLRDDKRPAEVSARDCDGQGPAKAGRYASDAGAKDATKTRLVALKARSAQPSVVQQLRALEDARRDGTIELPGRLAARRHQPARRCSGRS